MSAVFMKRILTGLAPDDEASAEALRKVQVGEVVKVEFMKPRSHKNLKRWWALMNLIYQNSDTFKSAEQVHDYVKILCGHCTQIVSKQTGEVYVVADSISFGRMDEVEFQQVWARACKAVAEHIIPGIDEQELELEVLKLIGYAA